MKKALAVLIFLLGVGAIAYPYGSDYLKKVNGSQVINAYQWAVKEKGTEEIDAKFAKAQEYNESLLGNPVQDPFRESADVVMQSDYYETLNINGIMGYIEIPKISVDLPIYHGTNESVLKKGVGHLEGSTLPIGGEGTHSILTGHTGLPNVKLFTDLTALEIGDLFYIQVLDSTLAYRVDEISVIEPDQTTRLRPERGMDYCSLFTCTPYSVNSHRLVVRGVRTEYNIEEKKAIAKVNVESDADKMVKIAAIITSVVMILLILIAIVFKKRESRR